MENNAAYIQSLEKSLERQHNEKMELLRTIETQSRLIDRLNYMLEDHRRRETYNREMSNRDLYTAQAMCEKFGLPKGMI